jgi:hypothetical protein
MPGINEIHPYNFPASQASDFDKLGHPGKFIKSITCTTGTTTFTGSNFGVGGVIVVASSTGTASLSYGGTIALATLATTQRRVEALLGVQGFSWWRMICRKYQHILKLI